ncbi:MCP four helix bundle domain-containing protein [Marinoscillum sp. 108]|uniref:MCP four helix bundle domain-containing protein n=1 Tax=Marinoscillum sp. 108 TaxID=2653151 RepID=UPI0012F0FD6C|nr:MCP four helix bundle domain-containing protein [Marinoscillum sp. 108]VXD19647.1 Four helix bundle sensory module for signal transduction [Marinoscillum sp. 108]
MEWKFSLGQRIRTGAALLVVFLLVLATNMMDSNHFRIVQSNLTTIYEDRLLAKDYLYKISRQIQAKRELIQRSDIEQWSDLNTALNDSIQILNDRFASTQLTENEALVFESLKRNIRSLREYELKLQRNDPLNTELTTSGSERYFTAVYDDLDALFKIQLEESDKVISNANRAIDTSNLISRIEIGVLIAIGLLIQLLVFMRPLK